jgi:hypothetical protein
MVVLALSISETTTLLCYSNSPQVLQQTGSTVGATYLGEALFIWKTST